MAAAASKQAQFSALPGQKIPRSKFPIDVSRLHTFDAGYLVPIWYLPMLPGDDVRVDVAALVRLLSPLGTPMMDNLYLDWFAFFGPNRLLWRNWERLQGARDNPDDSVDYVVPWLLPFTGEDPYNIQVGGVADGLSFPLGDVYSAQTKISALLHRMYRLTWNQWFRDQTYQNSVDVAIDDGPDQFEPNDILLRRNKRPDYFSMALDAPQMGAGVPIPFDADGFAPVWGSGDMTFYNTAADDVAYLRQDSGTANALWQDTATANDVMGLVPEAEGFPSGVYADVGAISGTMNMLRTAAILQQMKELDKRGGTRYVETLKTRWNVITRDDRLQRIEYIAGGSNVIGVSNVHQTSETSESSPQGNIVATVKGGFASSISYRAPEHGYLMVMVNVRARLTYQQQLSRHLTRATRYDFPEPLTMHLGEEPVMHYEIYWPMAGDSTGVYMPQVWGWQERWAVDRYSPSTVTGLFRSEASGSLDNWHLALDFGPTAPIHDGSWTEDDPPVDRVILLPLQPQFQINMAFQGYKISSMPVYGVPGIPRF